MIECRKSLEVPLQGFCQSGGFDGNEQKPLGIEQFDLLLGKLDPEVLEQRAGIAAIAEGQRGGLHRFGRQQRACGDFRRNRRKGPRRRFRQDCLRGCC